MQSSLQGLTAEVRIWDPAKVKDQHHLLVSGASCNMLYKDALSITAGSQNPAPRHCRTGNRRVCIGSHTAHKCCSPPGRMNLGILVALLVGWILICRLLIREQQQQPDSSTKNQSEELSYCLKKQPQVGRLPLEVGANTSKLCVWIFLTLEM